MRILCKSEVESLLDIGDAIAATEAAFRAKHMGTAGLAPNYATAIAPFNGRVAVKCAWLLAHNTLAIKVNTLYRDNPDRWDLPLIHSIVLVSDVRNGRPLAILEGTYLTGVRTGAVTAVATQQLARADAQVLGVIGAGYQAFWQIVAVCAVRPIDTIRIFDIDERKARDLTTRLSRKIDAECLAVSSSESAVREAKVCITVTPSREPVLKGEWLDPGVHVNAMGSFRTDMREVDTETVKRSDKIVVDCLTGCLEEAGDIVIPIAEGAFRPDGIHADLAEVVAGEKPGREYRSEITLFKSVGISIQDAAMAEIILDAAEKKEVGKEMDLFR